MITPTGRSGPLPPIPRRNEPSRFASKSAWSLAWEIISLARPGFAALRARPAWLFAFIVTCLLGMVGQLLQAPAVEHVTKLMHGPPDPRLNEYSALETLFKLLLSIWSSFPVQLAFGSALTALALVACTWAAKGEVQFPLMWALAVNGQIVNAGLSNALVGAFVALRGPTFLSLRDLANVWPSLAWAGPMDVHLFAFLNDLNVFHLYYGLILALGLEMAGGLPRRIAFGGAAAVLLLGAAFAAVIAV